ncbi:MAG: transcription elongation factor GreA [Chloroflexota bacterium]
MDRPVITVSEKVQLETELKYLKEVRRKEVIERLRAVTEGTDIFDNPDYLEAKREQAFVEGRIRELERLLAIARVVPDRQQAAGGVIDIGSRVKIEDESGEVEEIILVGAAHADVLAGKVSYESPVGAALMGKRAGDVVEVRTPGGVRRLKILEVS